MPEVLHQMKAGYVQVQIDQQPYMQGFMPVMEVYLAKTVGLAPADRPNLDSVFNMTKQVYDGMMDRGWGRIINVSSVNGSKGAFGQTNYAAAKAGMHGFTKSLALESARKGVTVNTISPGYIGTKMVTAIPKDVLDGKILPQIPISQLGKPEEVAGLIIYLCSDEAAFVTGANYCHQRRPAHAITILRSKGGRLCKVCDCVLSNPSLAALLRLHGGYRSTSLTCPLAWLHGGYPSWPLSHRLPLT